MPAPCVLNIHIYKKKFTIVLGLESRVVTKIKWNGIYLLENKF